MVTVCQQGNSQPQVELMSTKQEKIPQAPQEEGISVRYNSTVPTSSSSDHSPASSLMAATHCTAFQVELREQLPTPARKGCLLLPSPPSCLGAQPPCTFNCLWCLLDTTEIQQTEYVGKVRM